MKKIKLNNFIKIKILKKYIFKNIKKIVKENYFLLQHGEILKYQFNCNKLVGLTTSLNIIEKIKNDNRSNRR